VTDNNRRYVTADVFTHEMFGGNPVAVVLDAAGLSAQQMLAIASEFNYSETTFVLPPKSPDHSAWVRIFTPIREVPFAGHPNVGTAFVLARQSDDRNEQLPSQFVFEEEAGLVPVALIREEGTVIGAELPAPEQLSRRTQVPAERVAACLSLTSKDVCVERHQPQILSVGLPFLVVELTSRSALRQAKPDRSAYDDLLPLDGAYSVYAYTRDTGENTGHDMQARMFTPRMTEDPATGSATAATAALLAELRDAADGEIVFRFRQGVDMGRPSLLTARVLKRAGTSAAVYVGGRCVAMMQGTFHLAGQDGR
jgi:trans-2,3-dihydro-3-hydroxyanthranilate isomerase